MVTFRCGFGFIYPNNAPGDRSAKGLGAITHRKEMTVHPGPLAGLLCEAYAICRIASLRPSNCSFESNMRPASATRKSILS